jgi:hypothetical protein
MPPRRYVLDDRPGSPPDIRFGSGGITFTFAPPGIPDAECLTIRCDHFGRVWVSIQCSPARQSD